MSIVESALNEYKRDTIAKDSALQKAVNILDSFYAELSKNQDKLLTIIRKEGGNNWTYSTLPLSDHGGYSISYVISKYKDLLREKFHKQGYEGIVLYLDVNSIEIFLKVKYEP